MCEELNQELQKGKQGATMLAEHLYMMSAEQCQIQVEFNGFSYICDVRMKIQSKADRFTFKAITFEGHIIEEIEEIEYMQVKEVLAGDIRKIGDQYIVVNNNIPVIAIVSDAYLKKVDKPITEHPDIQRLIMQIQKLQRAKELVYEKLDTKSHEGHKNYHSGCLFCDIEQALESEKDNGNN